MKRSKKLEAALARAPAVGTCPPAVPRRALRAFLGRLEKLEEDRVCIDGAIVRASVEMDEVEARYERRQKDYLELFFRTESAEARVAFLEKKLVMLGHAAD